MLNELLWPFKQLPSKYVALDTETTGLFHQDIAPDVISIGLTEVKDFKITSSVEYLSKPEKNFSDNAFSIHGMSWEKTQDNPELSDSWDDICRVIKGELVVIHNALYDWRVLSLAASNRKLKLPVVEGVFCTQRASQPWAMANKIKCSERGASLAVLADHLDIANLRAENNGFHSARVDSNMLVLVTEELRSKSLP